MQIIDLLLNCFYPPRCMVCHQLLGVNPRRLICDLCLQEVSYIKNHGCEKCGKKLSEHYQPSSCPECANSLRVFDKGMVCFVYLNNIKMALQRFKFKHKKYYAKEFALFMEQKLKSESTMDYDGIVPIPLSSTREIHRGYNQSYLLSKELAKRLQLPLIECLEKIKEIPPQSSLNKTQRRLNVRGAYKFDHTVRRRLEKVLLVDDVFTTGATIEACCEVLKKNGVKSVEVITVASGMNTY